MLFNKIDSSVGMIMSVNKISIPYSDIVKIIGEPHRTNKWDRRSKALGYITEAEWLFEFFNTSFKIRYDSTSWLMNKRMKEKDTSGSKKIPPLEDVTYGDIIGDSKFVVNVIIKILYMIHDQDIQPGIYRGLIMNIFDGEMEKYKT